MAQGTGGRTARATALAAAAGVAFGAASSLVNATGAPWAQALSQLTNGVLADVTWSLVAFLGGLVVAAVPARRWTAVLAGTLVGTLTVLLAVVAYYATDTARGVYAVDERGGVHWDWVAGDLRWWLLAGLAVGFVLGFSGALARRGGPLRWWALAVLPATFFARGFAFGTLPSLRSRPSTVALVLIGLLVLVGLVDVGRHLAHRARRRPREAEPLAAG